ncbi:hypothetical protein L602_003400000170 [Cupriavidus gilardii J11]|uniref:PXPV repeat-containing protein n=1 Tax=Cupriavidus gilardii J11 TaxID=936133 RepID=A0A562BC37_9BURK|nr:hypothetical protein [Cupriavidus gilardii]TWG82733.1 hypothetical protein L602_003400000170 [Cupriavidus gilardii J11]
MKGKGLVVGAIAVLAAGLGGCAVYPAPYEAGVAVAAPPVYVAPAPVVVAPRPYYGPYYRPYPYRGYHRHRDWR